MISANLPYVNVFTNPSHVLGFKTLSCYILFRNSQISIHGQEKVKMNPMSTKRIEIFLLSLIILLLFGNMAAMSGMLTLP